tara:strand:- start:136 stop:300 length:165 start_codon:yes stop_codon:yes gene_type:complete
MKAIYVWNINNPHKGYAFTHIAGKPLSGRMAPSDCSMLMPTWESFLLASEGEEK